MEGYTMTESEEKTQYFQCKGCEKTLEVKIIIHSKNPPTKDVFCPDCKKWAESFPADEISPATISTFHLRPDFPGAG
jgi:hypothetical protein